MVTWFEAKVGHVAEDGQLIAGELPICPLLSSKVCLKLIKTEYHTCVCGTSILSNRAPMGAGESNFLHLMPPMAWECEKQDGG